MAIDAYVCDDPVFGVIRTEVDTAAGRVEVTGQQIPSVQITRSPVAPISAPTPIGTLDPVDLAMTVEGLAATIVPSSGGRLRGSFRVHVVALGGHVLLAPCRSTSHRLVRGTAYGGDNELGQFTRTASGEVEVSWSEHTPMFGGQRRPGATPEDAAIGYALAAAFGTGGDGVLARLKRSVLRDAG